MIHLSLALAGSGDRNRPHTCGFYSVRIIVVMVRTLKVCPLIMCVPYTNLGVN